ncbi:hypothetical protein BJ684DRAFT_15954 [Piptocephalis cylindrospora]|uniref:Uncharacterized protein n=1 Tax=Piptocephalis cylindrospora TaxID=1907219 RepID=A0A4P9Y742_9FUNG|nr:hypothetical protein BJ684DRAFT_15954 [Piptocephalis cylindrospora]|eukprot:RKP13670.1 hypothetical protein BJ684DRAFT_15954 [Piptocephalis cylindrospora]
MPRGSDPNGIVTLIAGKLHERSFLIIADIWPHAVIAATTKTIGLVLHGTAMKVGTGFPGGHEQGTRDYERFLPQRVFALGTLAEEIECWVADGNGRCITRGQGRGEKSQRKEDRTKDNHAERMGKGCEDKSEREEKRREKTIAESERGKTINALKRGKRKTVNALRRKEGRVDRKGKMIAMRKEGREGQSCKGREGKGRGGGRLMEHTRIGVIIARWEPYGTSM